MTQEKLFTEFKVIAVSDNTNSFGLYQFVAINKKGNGYKLHCGSIYKPQKNDNIVIEEVLTKSGNLEFRGVMGKGIEMPERMPDAPQELIDEIFNKTVES